MDLESSIAVFPNRFKECRTDMKVVQHYAPLENRDRALLLFITQRQWLPFCFMGPIFESRGLVGPLFHNFRSITEIGMEPSQLSQ